jgi:cytochrome c peroxidase
MVKMYLVIKLRSFFVLSGVFTLNILFYGCNDNGSTNLAVHYSPTPYSYDVPTHFPQMILPVSNSPTFEGVALGRKLYYDSILHPWNLKSCSSCHFQEFGFSTPGVNVLPHVNLAYNSKFLWNGRISNSLEDAMRFEVREFFGTDVSKLQNSAVYPSLFFKAFGSSYINHERIEMALAQFLRSIVSGNSKFDRFLRHEENLSLNEMMGFTIFNSEKGDCFHCHSLPLMTDGQLHNIGLDSVFVGSDLGFFLSSGNPADKGKFKTPSLRNVLTRSSFMHDGRFSTIDEVINHYNNDVKLSNSLDPIMTKPGKEFGLGLTPFEIHNLKAFLNTLTDTTIFTNPLFGKP